MKRILPRVTRSQVPGLRGQLAVSSFSKRSASSVLLVTAAGSIHAEVFHRGRKVPRREFSSRTMPRGEA
jgi:hypothetical protein